MVLVGRLCGEPFTPMPSQDAQPARAEAHDPRAFTSGKQSPQSRIRQAEPLRSLGQRVNNVVVVRRTITGSPLVRHVFVSFDSA
jgi:hypothetical protein